MPAKTEQQPQKPKPQPASDRLKVAVLFVCFNRRETTLPSIRSVMAHSGNFEMQPVLFDDASSDGTPEAVLAEFPQTIIVRGDGSTFWNGGLYRAWTRALDLPVDAFLWLNDDVELDPDALAKMERAWHELETEQGDRQFILVGATRDREGAITYGGYRRENSPLAMRLRMVEPAGELRAVDTFNGNIVLVPRPIVDRIGINDPAYFHNMGDIDYGLRAKAAAIGVFLVPNTLGLCGANTHKEAGAFGPPGSSFRQRWKRMNSHFGFRPRAGGG